MLRSLQPALAVLFTAFLAAMAAPAAAEPKVTTFTLDNGMRGVVIEDHRAPVATHMVWYRVGAADEPPSETGVAHYLEHLLFKGTEKYPEGAFSAIVAENGGQHNAFTSLDYTAYFQRIAVDRLELMMELEADRMVNITLTDEDAATERDVVLEERAELAVPRADDLGALSQPSLRPSGDRLAQRDPRSRP